MSQGGYRLREVSPSRFLEIEQDRQIAALTKLIPYCVQDGFTVGGEPSQYQNRRGGNRVDYLAYPFVVKEQVDKLCYFEVVHHNGRFVRTAYVEILLYGAF